MVGYFDSSVLLSVLLNDSNAEEALNLWKSCSERASSIMFAAECLTVLRRGATQISKSISQEWLQKREVALTQALEEIHLKDLDFEVLRVLNNEKRLAECRTLDAIHLATALYFQPMADESLEVYTFDKAMRKTACELGLAVKPEFI